LSTLFLSIRSKNNNNKLTLFLKIIAMRRFYSIFQIIVIIITTTSCSKKDIIPRKELPQILAEMYIADRALLSDPAKLRQADSLLVYEPILKKYGYTTKTLINTFNYYLPTPAKLKSSFMAARAILEKRLVEVQNQIALMQKREIVFATVHKLIREADSLRYMDSYERSLRWLLAPELFPNRPVYIPDSLISRYEHPKMTNWWLNNLKTESRHFYQYENNSSTIPLLNRPQPNQERISLPEH